MHVDYEEKIRNIGQTVVFMFLLPTSSHILVAASRVILSNWRDRAFV